MSAANGPYREPAPKPPKPPPLVRQCCRDCDKGPVGGCIGHGWACIKHHAPSKEEQSRERR